MWQPLFKSDTKFESGCGWPSFYEPISKVAIIYTPDNTHGMKRTEAECGRCKSHLGHVFEDGPPPTGLRYCVNGVVLDLRRHRKLKRIISKGSRAAAGKVAGMPLNVMLLNGASQAKYHQALLPANKKHLASKKAGCFL